MRPHFEAGKNIAIKTPSHEYEATVAFYRDLLGLKQDKTGRHDDAQSVTFLFGDKNLWIDKVTTISQAEIWLEVITPDITAAKHYIQTHHGTLCDEIEALPKGFKGFWVASPANIIHLLSQIDETEQ